MDRSSHRASHIEDITADSEAPDETIHASQEAPTPDRQPSTGDHVSDDAAGDEGIDEPAAIDDEPAAIDEPAADD